VGAHTSGRSLIATQISSRQHFRMTLGTPSDCRRERLTGMLLRLVKLAKLSKESQKQHVRFAKLSKVRPPSEMREERNLG
jgi:hypothetical protein